MVHPADESWPVERAKVRGEHLDIRLYESSPDGDPLREDGHAGVVLRIREVVVPFLDTLGHYELAKAVLEHDAGLPAGAESFVGPIGSPMRSMVLGLLALAVGDKETAVAHLTLAHALEQSRHEDVTARDDGAARAVAYWADKVERATRLP